MAEGSEAYIESPSIFNGGGILNLNGSVITGTDKKSGREYLTNTDNTIEGAGRIEFNLILKNDASGVIDADVKGKLTLAVWKLTISNAGLVEATGDGVCEIKSAVDNTGTLEAAGGTLKLVATVTGSGAVAVAAGSVVITNTRAKEAISFTGQSGTLELDQSQTYSGDVEGFSLTGQTTLDLRDIGFVSPNEATFSGTANSGVLTVTDGTHTAQITLLGDYTGSTFVASSDGKGGVDIVDASAQAPSVTHFAIAMATLGDTWRPRRIGGRVDRCWGDSG